MILFLLRILPRWWNGRHTGLRSLESQDCASSNLVLGIYVFFLSKPSERNGSSFVFQIVVSFVSKIFKIFPDSMRDTPKIKSEYFSLTIYPTAFFSTSFKFFSEKYRRNSGGISVIFQVLRW